MRRRVFILAIGFIALWTGYCLLDLVYVGLAYWALTPWLGILPFFTDPIVEPGFWGDYLKRLTASWGSMVTIAGTLALLVCLPAKAEEGLAARVAVLRTQLRRWAACGVRAVIIEIRESAIETYPVIPKSELTKPRRLHIEEPLPPRSADLSDPAAKAMIRTTCKAAGAPRERILPGLRRIREFATGAPSSPRPQRWSRNHGSAGR